VGFTITVNFLYLKYFLINLTTSFLYLILLISFSDLPVKSYISCNTSFSNYYSFVIFWLSLSIIFNWKSLINKFNWGNYDSSIILISLHICSILLITYDIFSIIWFPTTSLTFNINWLDNITAKEYIYKSTSLLLFNDSNPSVSNNIYYLLFLFIKWIQIPLVHAWTVDPTSNALLSPNILFIINDFPLLYGPTIDIILIGSSI